MSETNEKKTKSDGGFVEGENPEQETTKVALKGDKVVGNDESKRSRRSSFGSASTTDRFQDEASTSSHNKKKKTKRKKKRNSASSVGSMGSGGFISRLDTSLLASVEFSIAENEEYEVIDVEEAMELNRQKEKERKKLKKSKNKKDAIDPRLYPSYYDNQENNFDDEDDDLSMSDFGGRNSAHRRSISNRSGHQVVSAVQGRKIVQLGVIVSPTEITGGGKKKKTIDFSKALADSQKEGVVRGIRPNKDITSFSSPVRLLEIENGQAILVKGIVDTTTKSKTTMSVAAVKQTKAPKGSDAVAPSLRKRTSDGGTRGLEVVKPELGRRNRQDGLRRRLVRSMDDINALNLGRQVQLWIPFLSGYESYLLGQVVEVLLDSVASDSNGSSKTNRQDTRKAKAELNEILSFALQNHNVSRVINENLGRRWNFSSHWFQRVIKSRWYDAWGRLPIVRVPKFPATENFPTPGDWLNKFWIQDPEKISAQDILANFSYFEATKRNQYGTYIGRSLTNDFRVKNRLPVDESIVHAFVLSPMSTMIDNGAVHVLQQMAKHWLQVLAEPFGNFTHHRLEQLDPFETMRFHMPAVCVVLSSLRGRNLWDARVLGPFMYKCQTLTTSFTANDCRDLVKDMQSNIVPMLCAGVESIEKPLSQWLEAIEESCRAIEEEAKQIYKEVTGIEIGLQFGYDLITQVSWKIPSDKELEKAILLELQGLYPGEIVHERNIRKALLLATPRDKRTLIELVKLNLEKTKPAKVLIGQVKNLLKRVIRREFLNEAIRELSTGEQAFENELKIDDWYWLNEENDKKSVYIFEEEEEEDDNVFVCRFVKADSGADRLVSYNDLQSLKCRRYIPVAESIVRAQRCYMNIELDHCHKFKYNAFAEFAFLRTALNRLAVVSQIFCEELDSARLNILQEVKAMNKVKVEAGDLEPGNTYYIHNSLYNVYAPFVCKKKYSPSDPEWQKLEKVEMVKVIPQSTIVVGSGITGLMTTIHCAENVLASGGDVKLHESSDASTKEGSVFEQAQIIRLDPCWVAMLRYHLGTAFEETFIPTSTESYAHLGNSLVKQGFVEITIKDLESILHREVTRLWSKEIIGVSMESKVGYDPALNSMVKLGEHLEVGDKVLRRVDPNGTPCKELHRWTIAEAQNAETLGVGDLCAGEEYDVYVKREKTVLPFKLTKVDLYTRTYKFESLKKKTKDIEVTPHDLPPVYPKGSKRLFKTVLIKCDTKGDSDDFHCDTLSEKLEGMKFIIDIGYNHVLECIGKPDSSPHHFEVSSSEPFGFCCISRLDGSMESRTVRDFLDSNTVQNTRIIGNSTKLVRQKFIAEYMVKLINMEHWQEHFTKLIENSEFSSLNDKDPIVTKLVEAVEWLDVHASEYRRQALQIQLSETVDNFYLGMELNREYQTWKSDSVDRLLFPIRNVPKHRKRNMEELKELLRHNIDVLWFEACLEVLRRSDVYDTDSKQKIPTLHLINCPIKENLRSFIVGEGFRVAGKANRKFDVLLRNKERKLDRQARVFARNSDGVVQKFDEFTEVFREGCLTRSTDGDGESKVAIATFPMSQYINHHSICLNDASKGYVFASIGDQQSTSNFMHPSAFSGGCINAVHFNRFLRSAINGVSLTDRFELYSKETSWSNGEIVQRGIMTSFGEDACLRPGFSYKQGLKYVWSQVMGGKQNLDNIHSKNWMTKFAASMIPRGMELNNKFIKTLKEDTNIIIFDLFLEGAMNDNSITWSDGLEDTLKARKDDILNADNSKNQQKFWEQFLEGLTTLLDDASCKRLQDIHGKVAKGAEQYISKVINFAKESHLYDQRSSQGLWNQPKPVDSIADDYAADGQNLPNSLAQSTALCAASVALLQYASIQEDQDLSEDLNYLVIVFKICSIILSIINMFISAQTILNSGKYKTRNGRARAIFLKMHFMDLRKAIFGAMDTKEREEMLLDDENPFIEDLEKKKKRFVDDVLYYGLEDPDEFIYDYRRLRERGDQPAAFKHFQKLLVTYYIPDVYQINSYVQESLVEIYKVCDEIHTMLSQDEKKTGLHEREDVNDLFHRVTRFGPPLEQSVDSKAMNSTFYLACRYIWSIIVCSSSKRENPIASIENETYGIIRASKIVSEADEGSIFKRQIPDLEYLYRATVETGKGAVVYISACLVFVACCLLAISNIVELISQKKKILSVVALWAQLIAVVPALLSLCYFVRHFGGSLWLWVKLGVKKPTDKRTSYGLLKIKGFIFMQLLVTLFRICAVLGSAAALVWIIVTEIQEIDAGDPMTPVFIALVAFCLVIVTAALFWFVEFTIGYNLPTNLGEIVGDAFGEELESMHKELSISDNKFDTKQSQERITWEYVAREFSHKYRFDAILGPDRFGPILQYIQCGVEKRKEIDEGDEI